MTTTETPPETRAERWRQLAVETTTLADHTMRLLDDVLDDEWAADVDDDALVPGRQSARVAIARHAAKLYAEAAKLHAEAADGEGAS